MRDRLEQLPLRPASDAAGIFGQSVNTRGPYRAGSIVFYGSYMSLGVVREVVLP